MPTNRIRLDIDTDDVIADVFDYIFQSFDAALTEKFIESIEIPITVDMALMRIYKITAWATCEHDGKAPDPKKTLELLRPDEEPEPVSIDPWARGTVTTKKPVQEDRNNDYYDNSSRHNDTPSIASRLTGTRAKSEAGSRISTGTGLRKMGTFQEDQLIWNLDEEPDVDYDNLGATGHMFNMHQKMKRQRQNLPETTTEEKGEFQLLDEQIKRAAGELKGSKYTIDQNGNVIALNPMKPESLPPFALEVQPKIINGLPVPKTKPPSRHAADDSAAQANNNTKKKKKTVRVAGSRAMDTSFFTAANTLSTALAGGEYITTINPGVILRVDDKVLAGPPAPIDPSKPTRQQYLDRVASSQTLNGGDSLVSNASGIFRPGSPDTLLKDKSSVFEDSALPLSMQFPDIDIFEGGRKIERVPSTDSVKAGSQVLQQGSTFSLQHSSHAGKNIAATVVPTKATGKQHESVVLLSGGPDKIHPRDRDAPLSQVPVAERKRLPAPPIGQTTGHGLSPQRSAQTLAAASKPSGGGSVASNMSNNSLRK